MKTCTTPQQRSNACVVMASGAATRFGSNKLLAPLQGVALIEHVLDACEGLFDQLVVVTRHTQVAALCEKRGVQVVLHELPHRNDTVRLGMEALGHCDTVSFFQADQPLIRRESITALLAASEGEPDSIWRTIWEDEPGAPVLFPSWAFDELKQLPLGKGGGYVAKKYPERVRFVPVRDKFELFDIDTQADLQALETLLASH